ncbi:MAG TPA: hypothetical protein VFO83_16865 [Aggregicoccus sp.]|nr:hypothetical protein [Aggregicoccus sp.]
MTAVRVLLLVLLALPAHAQQQVDLPALLQRLGQGTPGMGYLVQQRLQSMTVTSLTEERDGGGRVTHTRERVQRMAERDGRRASELVRARDDGRDVTAQQRAEAERRGTEQAQKADPSSSFELPFTPENQPRHRFSVVGPDAQDPSKLRLRFEPADEPGQQVMQGEALVDPERGHVLQLRFRPSQFPSLLVDRMDVEMDFRAHPDVGAVVDRIVVDWEGGLLFFKKRGRSAVTFSDVVFKPAPEPRSALHAAP